MPTVMIIDGYRFHFFANEGPRAHVHVVKGGGTAKVWLDDLSFADWDDLTGAERRRIIKMVQEHKKTLLDAWNEFFAAK